MPYKKSAVSSQQIVQAATRVLARQGYAHTSLMDIAKEAGMSKGAVHYHFPSKESLVSKVLEMACEVVAQRTVAAWQARVSTTDSVRASLTEMWTIRSERSAEVAVVADLIAQSLYDDSLRPKIASYYRLASSQALEYLTKFLQEAGLRPKVAPELVPRLINGLLDGLMMQHFVDPEAFTTEEVVKAFELIATSLYEFPLPVNANVQPEASIDLQLAATAKKIAAVS